MLATIIRSWTSLACLVALTACARREVPKPPLEDKPAAKAATSASPATASASASALPEGPATLVEARRGFTTKVEDTQPRGTAPPRPPIKELELVRYESPVGKLAAYVSPASPNGQRRPAIIWLTGGFDNAIDATAWQPAPPENDQSARAFREAGLVLMLPSLRGGNDNPGRREIMFGEVDDVLAAANFLATLPYVDSTRIYLGGHSTGATLALLVAAATPRFRAVFAFGPTADVRNYGLDVPGLADEKEVHLRSPRHFVGSIRTPTFLIEGAHSPNVRSVQMLMDAAGAAPLEAALVPNADHFSVLAPATADVARMILADTGPTTQIRLGR